jgi:flagellar L-ring protein precursor FlgH
MKRRTRAAGDGRKGWVMGLVMSAACGGPIGAPREPREREYVYPVALDDRVAARTTGSLWSDGAEFNFLFSDQRAFRTGDLVTIRVEEFATAQRGARTSLERTSQLNAEIQSFLGLIERLREMDIGLDGNSLLGATTAMGFSGSGETGRTERLEATVQAIVRERLPNGLLFVEGRRIIVVNNEEQYLYISGVVRPIDIDDNNVVSSSRLADADIEFTGRGDLTDQQRRGWLARFFARIWPF